MVGRTGVGRCTICCLPLAVACASIQFERSPYTIRDLDVVFSHQEELTFLVWRLGANADPNRVRFELWNGSSYEPIRLEDAAFPAEPYPCDRSSICFQYQIRGLYQLPSSTAPLRSVHEDQGGFAGPEAEVVEVTKTIELEPMALDNNAGLDLGVRDWFRRHNIPMRRDFEWQLVATTACEPNPGSWEPTKESVPLEYNWVEDDACLMARPIARHARGTIEAVPLTPTAETFFAEQTYVPTVEHSPIAYGILLDLHIPDEGRCQDIQRTLVGTVDATIDGIGNSTRLGVFTPRDESGALDGCTQSTSRHYPITDMVDGSLEAAALVAPRDVRVLWIYANNIEHVPPQHLLDQLATAVSGITATTYIYSWAIASNTVLEIMPWEATSGWRPIEDRTFMADIERVVTSTLPFSTMLHGDDTLVSIHDVPRASEPLYFKLCYSSPIPYRTIHTPGDPETYGPTSPHVPWPPGGDKWPAYTASIDSQFLVPFESYVEHEIRIGVEVCVRFCDHPFRTAGGADYESWLHSPGPRPMERCARR